MSPSSNGSGDAAVRGFLLTALFLVLPLLVVPQCCEAFEVPKTFLLAMVTVLLGVSWLGALTQTGTASWVRTPMNLPLALLCAWGLIAWAFSYHHYLGARAMSLALSYALLFCWVRDSGRDALARYLWAARAAAVAVAAMAILNVLGVPLFGRPAGPGLRDLVVSTLGNSQYVACFLAPLLPLLLATAFRRKGLARLPGLLGVALAGLAVALAGSRLAYVAAAGGLLVFAATVGRGFARRRTRLVALIVALAFAACTPVAVFLWGRRGADERVMTWRVAAALGCERWTTGHGPGTFSLLYPDARTDLVTAGRLPDAAAAVQMGAHNECLQVFAETGVVGMVLALWLTAAAVRLCARALVRVDAGRRPVAAALVAGLACIGVLAAGHFPLRMVPVGALACLFAGGLACLPPDVRRREISLSRLDLRWRRLAFFFVCVLACCFALLHVRRVAAHVCWRRSVTRARAGDHVAAARLLTQAAAMDPHDGEIRYRLGTVLFTLERYRQALAAFDRSLRTHATGYGHLMAGKCHARLGNRYEARARLARAAQMDPALRQWAARALEELP